MAVEHVSVQHRAFGSMPAGPFRLLQNCVYAAASG